MIQTSKAPRTPKTPAVDVPLHALGAMIELGNLFQHRGAEVDAAAVSHTALGVLLRQLWAIVSGRPNSNPRPETIGLKLYQRGIIDKPSLRLLSKLTIETSKPQNVRDTLVVCRVLLDLIKAEMSTSTTAEIRRVPR